MIYFQILMQIYLSLSLKNVYLSIVYINYFFILAKTPDLVIFHEYSCMVKLTLKDHASEGLLTQHMADVGLPDLDVLPQ